MKKVKLNFDKFETLSENAEGQLVSGFSPAFEGQQLMGGDGSNIVCVPVNNTNCLGGNCSSGCGGSGKD